MKTTADPYAPDSPDDGDDEEHDDDGPSNAYAPPAKKPSKKPKKPSKKPSKKPYAPEPEPTTPEPTTAEPTTEEVTTEAATTEAVTTKPKKNPYAPEPTTPPDYETTTAEPTTTSKLRSTWRPDLTTTTEKPSKNPYSPPGGDDANDDGNDDGYGDDSDDMDNVYAPDSEVKGDPHFMVRSPGQEAVCFDADAPPGEQIPLVFDPVIGLSISGTIEHREVLNRTVIDTMHILTPGGVSVHISHEGLIVDGYRNPFKKIHPKVTQMISNDNGFNLILAEYW